MTTGLITPTTKGQEVNFDRLVQDTIRQARKKVQLDKDAMQRLLTNDGLFQDDVVASLIRHSAVNNLFGLLTSFEFTVPKSYDHGTQLTTFALYAKNEKFCTYNKTINDANFAKATNRLVPGKTYGGKIFGINLRVSSEDCLLFLATQRAILVGAQGLSLVRQLKKGEFPVGKWTMSFDEKDALWAVADGDHGVPGVNYYSVGVWNFRLGYFGHDWHDDDCLLSVSDLSV